MGESTQNSLFKAIGQKKTLAIEMIGASLSKPHTSETFKGNPYLVRMFDSITDKPYIS